MKFNGVFTVRFRGEAINEERMATEVILALDDLIAAQGEHGNHIYFDRWKDVDVDVEEDAGTRLTEEVAQKYSCETHSIIRRK